MKGVLLRSRDGRRFLVAQLMDSMAGGLSLVVLPWMVLDAGGSRSLAGAAFLIATIPYLVLGLHAGELGDRRGRRRIMVSAAVLQAVAACVLPLTVAVGPAASDLPLALIFAAGMGVTAGRVFVDAAAFGATARLVGDEHFVEGQANLSLVWSLGFLIGPALGGGLIGLVGAVEALWVEAAGFALAAVLLASIRTELGPEAAEGARRAGVLSGVEVVARDRTLRRLTSVSMAWNLTVNVFKDTDPTAGITLQAMDADTVTATPTGGTAIPMTHTGAANSASPVTASIGYHSCSTWSGSAASAVP